MPPGVTLEQMLRVMNNSEPPATEAVASAPEIVVTPVEGRKKAAKKVRAKDEEGKFLADDPATPDVDEAWVEPDREN